MVKTRIMFLPLSQLKKLSGRMLESGCGKTEAYTMVLSVLPFDGGTYKQAPFEDCSKGTRSDVRQPASRPDKVVEIEDNTDLSGELLVLAVPAR